MLADRTRRSSTASASRNLHPRLEGERERIQALTDGVFAITITLLVLDLKPSPVTISGLPSTLRGMVPMLLVYALTFLVLGGMWFRHRTEFTYISRVDHPLAWLNLGLLGFVALVPWSASLVGQHRDAHLTVLVYNVNLAAATLLQQLGWLYATGHRHLTGAMPPRLVRWSRMVGLLPAVDYLLAVALSFVNPLLALAIDVVVPLAYLTGLRYRLLYRLSRR
jgi:uncharacterized membrane protein